MKYEVSLQNFTGPLDLLLHLVTKAKVAIEDIFISDITDQYLGYMNEAQTLDMEQASDFLQVAATLLYIKSRALLPVQKVEEEDDGVDPEQELIARLYEYKLYKEASVHMKSLREIAREYRYKLPEQAIGEDLPPVFINADISALFAAFKLVLTRAPKEEVVHEEVVIRKDGFSVRAQSRYIMDRLTIEGKLDFFDLFSKRPTREEISVTFLAMLELVHMGEISIKQGKQFDKITVKRQVAKDG